MIRDGQARSKDRRTLTRRKFGMKVCKRFSVLLGAAAFTRMSERTALGTETPWSIAMIPDPQFLASRCGALYSAVMQWVLNNQASAAAGALVTNFKAVLGVGDCVNTASAAGEKSAAAAAWGILDSNNFPWATPPGNHDMANPAPSDRTMSSQFQTGGFFASDVRVTKFTGPGSTLACPGTGGGTAFWGGSIGGVADPCNYFIRLAVGTRKLLILSLEYQPSTPTLTWAKSIHDTYPDHECVVVTHSYLTDMGSYSAMPDDPTWNQGGQGYNNDDGSLSQTSGLASGGNSGYKQWNNVLKTWGNLTMVLCGHYVYQPYHNTGPNSPWYWQRVAAASASSRAQTVQQIFYNEQELDNPAGAYCSDGTSDAAHVFVLKFPGDGTLEGYATSVNSAKWIGAAGSTPASSPVLLFKVNYPGIPAGTSAMISSGAGVSAGAVVK